MIKVILIEDEKLVRAGIKHMLSSENSIELIAEAETGKEGIELIKALNPDLILLNYGLPDTNGLSVTIELLKFNPDLKIIILTAIVNDYLAKELFEAGIKGYITKNARAQEMIEIINSVYQDKIAVDAKISKCLSLSPFTKKNNTIKKLLSKREYEIMMLIVSSASVKEIAKTLGVNLKTAYSYRARIFQKLNVNTDVQLTFIALRHKLIKLEDSLDNKKIE